MKNWTPQEVSRFIAIMAIFGLFAFALAWEIAVKGDEQTKSMLIGALIGAFSTGGQFLFGTTPASNKKDDTIAQLAANATPTPAPTPPIKG